MRETLRFTGDALAAVQIQRTSRSAVGPTEEAGSEVKNFLQKFTRGAGAGPCDHTLLLVLVLKTQHGGVIVQRRDMWLTPRWHRVRPRAGFRVFKHSKRTQRRLLGLCYKLG